MGAKEVTKGLSEASQQEMLLKERKANSAWRKLCRNKSAMFGLVLVVFVTVVSILVRFYIMLTQQARIF